MSFSRLKLDIFRDACQRWPFWTSLVWRARSTCYYVHQRYKGQGHQDWMSCFST